MAKKEAKPKSKARKIVSWIFTGLFGIFFVAVVAVQISGFVSRDKNYGIPKFNGIQFNLVLTDSMEPDYKVNTLLVVKEVKPEALKVGDDITFYYKPWSSYFSNPIVTHRIREIQINEDVEVGNGHYTFIVGGINTESKNALDTSNGQTGNCLEQHQEVSEQYILGKVVKNSYVAGKIYKFASSTWGLLTLLIIPTMYICVTSVLDLFKAVKEPDEETSTEEKAKTETNVLQNLSEEEIKKLKEEMIEEMMKGKEK